MIRWVPMRHALSCAGALLFLALPARAQRPAGWPSGTLVQATPHNLTVPAASTAPVMTGRVRHWGEVCVYCHTPHGGPDWSGAPRPPLVNRTRPNAAYRMPQHGAQQMLQDPSPSNQSRVCLSCHDGSIALDNIVNRPQPTNALTPLNETIDRCESCHKGGNPAGGLDWEGVWFNPDMRDQHPFSVVYDPSRRPGQFKPASGGTVGGLPLFSGRVECPTCHEPHTEQFRYFLRQSNVGNSLCLACHNSVPADPVHAQ